MVNRSKKNTKLKGGKPVEDALCKEISTLTGHSGYLTSVAFHSTEPVLATGSWDKTANFWLISSENPSTSPLLTLPGHKECVDCVAFQPSGNLLATGSSDRTVKIWRFSPNETYDECIDTLVGHTDKVVAVAFHPNGDILVTGSWDNTAKIWHYRSDRFQYISNLTGHNGWVTSVAFHPNGQLIATGSNDNTAKVWLLRDNLSAVCVANLNGHTDWVVSVSFHPTTYLIATGSWDNTVKLWHFVPNGPIDHNPVALLNRHTRSVTSVAFHPNGKYLASGSSDKTVRIWRLSRDLLNAECVDTFIAHISNVTSIAFHPNGKLLATGSSDKTAKIWDCSKIIILERRIEALTRASLATKAIKELTTENKKLSNAVQGRIGNPPDTLQNRQRQAEIVRKKYLGLLPRNPISFTQCDSCRAADAEAAAWAEIDPQYRVYFNEMSISHCTNCPGVAEEVDTDEMPGGRMSRKKVKKMLSRH